MIMSSEKEKHNEKGILARTATYTTKRARRAQTKLKQRVGKGDETKDEVFDEFLLNFNKQQSVAARLHRELKNYLGCISAMQVAAENFTDAISDVYEDDWTGRDMLVTKFVELNSNWTKLSVSLTDEVLEPLIAYQKPFPDVKIRINKRARKLVDYDHSRHIVDTLRAKGASKPGDIKKLNVAEEEYQKAKDIFIELTSELYEELPALYDSRIGFYVSCFQSIFTLEEVFHRETSQAAHQLNDLMDQLIVDFSAGTYSSRKPFSAGMETTSNLGDNLGDKEDTESGNSSLTQFYDVAVLPDENEEGSGSQDSPDDDKNRLSSDISLNEEYVDVNNKHSTGRIAMDPFEPEDPGPPEDVQDPSPPEDDDDESNNAPANFVPNERISSASDDTPHPDLDAVAGPADDISNERGEEHLIVKCEEEVPSNNIVAYKNTKTDTNPYNLIVPSSIYKVRTTHKYAPEDEDELAFERGEIIHVIPYEDPDEQDEGWLMGVMDTNGLVGVFPENFSKPIT